MIPSPCTILIGICTGGTMRSETVTSLIGAMEVLKAHGVGVNVNCQIGGYVAHNRNNLVRQAQAQKFDYLMFIDNDMVFLPSAIQRLLDADKEIVAGMYNARGVPGKPVISTLKRINPETDPNYGKMILDDQIPAQLFKCWALGTGFMLINMSVFDKLESPWFVAFEEPTGEHHTEDIEFCKRAHEVGIDVWCSPTISIQHIGTKEY